MTNRLLILIFSTVVLCGTNGQAFAQPQNSLREGPAPTLFVQSPQQGTPTTASPFYDSQDIPPVIREALEKRPSESATDSQNPNMIVDRHVAPAVHLTQPVNNIAPITLMLDSLSNRSLESTAPARNQPDHPEHLKHLEPNSIESSANLRSPESSLRPIADEPDNADAEDQSNPTFAMTKKFDREKFMALVKQLAINTGIVMCAGIGFILVAKQYYKGKSPRQQKNKSLPIQIKSTLKLSPKSNLHLIEAGEHRLIVATDQNGIKSMVRLSNSFSETLGSMEELAGELNHAPEEGNPPDETGNAGIYSLATMGKSITAGLKPSATAGGPSHDNRDQANGLQNKARQPDEPALNQEDEIRRKMEIALREHGLKDLILETLRKD